MATLSVQGLSKSYGKKPALRDINLDIGDGEFFCVLGPSGAGKGTLIRLLREGGNHAPVLLGGAP